MRTACLARQLKICLVRHSKEVRMAWPTLTKTPTDHRIRLIDGLVSGNFISAEVGNDLKKNVVNWPDDQSLIGYLASHTIVTPEQINKVYAKIFAIPYITLPSQVDENVMKIIPKDVCLSYHIVAYAKDEKTLRIAAANPLRIKENQPGVLANLKKQSGLQFALSLTSEEELARWLALYPSLAPVTAKSLPEQKPLPTEPQKVAQPEPAIDLIDRPIPHDLLTKVPYALAAKYRFVVFDHEGLTYAVAAQNPDDPRLGSVWQYIENKNHVVLDVHKTDSASIDHALTQYGISRMESISLSNRVISQDLLHKIPYSVAAKYRFVIFEQNGGVYKVATDRPTDAALTRICDYIEKHNGVALKLSTTDSASLNVVLKQYGDSGTTIVPIWLLPPAATMPEAKQAGVDAKTAPATKTESTPSDIAVGKPLSNVPFAIAEPKLSFIQKILVRLGLLKINPKIVSQSVLVEKPEMQKPVAAEALAKANEKSAEVAQHTPVIEPSAMIKNDTTHKPAVLTEEASPAKKPELSTLDKTKQDALYQKISEDSKDHAKDEDEEEGDLGSLLDKDVETAEELDAIIKSGFVPKIVAAIVSYAITLHASDVHIEAEANEVRIRYRVDGMLQDVARLPIEQQAAIASRIKILSKLKIDETRIPQDGRFDVAFKDRAVDLRVSSMPTVHGEKIVMRILDKSHGIMSLEELGVVGRAFDVVLEAIKKPYGIVLSTGPTGSGKSTTLYAILNRISVPTVNVITLEDPVEYEITGVNQSQIKPKIGYTFAEGLRSVLRQDPNIVMVGEIRDAETASMATHAALTGHLVLSTLHTNDAPGALPRLINMGVEPFLITSSINAVEAQRLVRKVCQNCKEEIELPPAVVDEIKKELDKIPQNNPKDRARIKTPMHFFHGKGCEKCKNGYKGRIGIYEVMPMSDKIEELAISKAAATDIGNQAVLEGMITMKQDGLLKALQGMTTVDEVMRETSV